MGRGVGNVYLLECESAVWWRRYVCEKHFRKCCIMVDLYHSITIFVDSVWLKVKPNCPCDNTLTECERGLEQKPS